MKHATLEALKGSILKWEMIAKGEGVDDGPYNCPLCTRFNNPLDIRAGLCFSKVDGERCPVAIAANDVLCSRTPYSDWSDATNCERGARAETPKLIAIAQREVDFLKSLLPAEKEATP